VTAGTELANDRAMHGRRERHTQRKIGVVWPFRRRRARLSKRLFLRAAECFFLPEQEVPRDGDGDGRRQRRGVTVRRGHLLKKDPANARRGHRRATACQVSGLPPPRTVPTNRQWLVGIGSTYMVWLLQSLQLSFGRRVQQWPGQRSDQR
jgi:hypothetical protein